MELSKVWADSLHPGSAIWGLPPLEEAWRLSVHSDPRPSLHASHEAGPSPYSTSFSPPAVLKLQLRKLRL